MNVSVSCATVIRFLVYGVPTLLVALIAAAFVNVSLLSACLLYTSDAADEL